MAFFDFLVLSALLTAGVALVSFGVRQRTRKRERVQSDLRAALGSHDYRQLDDFLTLHGGTVTKAVRTRVETRRAELYIEHDDTGVARIRE